LFLNNNDRKSISNNNDEIKSKRRSVGYSNESESDCRRFVKLNKEKNRSTNDLELCREMKKHTNQQRVQIIDYSKRSKSSPDVNNLGKKYVCHNNNT